MDVKTAFLQSYLEDEIYMEQLEECVNEERQIMCANLTRAFMVQNKLQSVKMLELTLSSRLIATRNAVRFRMFTSSR